jgi:NAD(P)-dependent dehydrogenase (short-subunit alcohol dehydrogenase family)
MGKALAGKAVVVTGSGRGIGAAYARHAASEGAKVVVNDVDAGSAGETVAAIRAAGGTAVARVADITSWSEAEGLVQFCVKEYGALDGFVNNAGLFHLATIGEETEARVRRIVEVNVLGVIFCGLHALRQMLRQGRGSLVSVTSGAHAGLLHGSMYGATKGAVASATYGWAMETEGTGVRVNAISPFGSTRMIDTADEFMKAHGGGNMMKMEIPPETNAPIMSFLLSDAAAGINGQIVRVQNKSVGIMTHPSVLHPAREAGQWTTESVREAFEQDFSKRLLPLGVAALDAKLVDYTVPYATKIDK